MSGRNDTPSSKAGSRAVNAGLTAFTAYDALHQSSVATGAASNAQIAKSAGTKLAAKGAGGSGGRAAKAAAKAAESNLASMAAKMLDSKVMQFASRAAPVLLAARAGWKAKEGYDQDGLRGAGRGVVQTLDLSKLVMQRGLLERGYDAMFGQAGGQSTPPQPMPGIHMAGGVDRTTMAITAMYDGSNAAGAVVNPGSTMNRPARLSPTQIKEFASANREFGGQQAGAKVASAEQQPQGGPRGFANPSVQKAAQEARGVQNVTDWARNAQPAEKKK